MSNRDQTPAYVAIKDCGCVVATIVDDGNHPKRVADFLRECALDGLPIYRKTVAWVRKNWGDCEAHKASPPPKEHAQITMF